MLILFLYNGMLNVLDLNPYSDNVLVLRTEITSIKIDMVVLMLESCVLLILLSSLSSLLVLSPNTMLLILIMIMRLLLSLSTLKVLVGELFVMILFKMVLDLGSQTSSKNNSVSTVVLKPISI